MYYYFIIRINKLKTRSRYNYYILDNKYLIIKTLKIYVILPNLLLRAINTDCKKNNPVHVQS